MIGDIKGYITGLDYSSAHVCLLSWRGHPFSKVTTGSSQ